MGFVLAYGLGIALVWTFNWLAFGTFGVTLSAWRRPNPLHDLADLSTNLLRYRTQFLSLVSSLGVSLVLGLVTAGVGLLARQTRRATAVVLGAALLALSMEAGLTVLTGTVTGVRASLWAWPACVLPAAVLLTARAAGLRRLGAVALVGLTMLGILAWRQDLSEHQRTRAQYAALVSRVAVEKQRSPDLPVVLWMDPRVRATATGNMTAVTLQMMSQDLEGIYPRWCAKAECTRIAATTSGAQRSAGSVSVQDGAIVLRVPGPPPWL